MDGVSRVLRRAKCFIMLVLSAASAVPGNARGQSYSDSDWNVTLVDSCGLPSKASARHQTVGSDRKLAVTLGSGDVGKCGSDNQQRHRAPYWERAELTADRKMPLGHRHTVRVEVQFSSGFTGERETFFQIHGWAQNCKKAYPPVMMKFTDGRLRVETLRRVSALGSGRHRNALEKTISIVSLYGKPARFEIDFDTRSKPGFVSVSIDGRQIVKDAPVDFAKCAEPYVKIGIYRPGGKGSETSAALFDDLEILMHPSTTD